jgi:hypothetical protein
MPSPPPCVHGLLGKTVGCARARARVNAAKHARPQANTDKHLLTHTHTHTHTHTLRQPTGSDATKHGCNQTPQRHTRAHVCQAHRVVCVCATHTAGAAVSGNRAMQSGKEASKSMEACKGICKACVAPDLVHLGPAAPLPQPGPRATAAAMGGACWRAAWAGPPHRPTGRQTVAHLLLLYTHARAPSKCVCVPQGSPWLSSCSSGSNKQCGGRTRCSMHAWVARALLRHSARRGGCAGDTSTHWGRR